MATTPNTYGRFIGRVGALAVALGIGAAIANSPGIAVAQDGPSGASGSASNTGTTTGPSNSSDSPAPAAEDAEPSGDDDAAPEGSTDDVDGEDGEDADDEQAATDDALGGDPAPEESDELDETSDSGNEGEDDSSPNGGSDPSQPQSTGTPQIAATSPGEDDEDESRARIADISDSQDGLADSAFASNAPQAAETSTFLNLASVSESSTATAVTTGLGGFVGTVLSALGFGSQAASGPAAPPQPPLLWAMLGWVRREIGNMIAPFVAGVGTPVAALSTEDASITAVSPLGTPEQLAAERIAAQTANTLPVALMKLVLRQQFLNAANEQYPEGLDEGSLAALDKAVDEYAMAAAFQQQLLNSMTPTVVTQVAPPHIWFGQNVPGSRILYDNPDTIYRFMGVNGASEYEIRGQFHNYSPDDPSTLPADTTFSVLEGLAGTTSSILTVDDDFEINDDGTFVITVSTEPTGGPNHLQLTSGSTIIAARNTLGNWNEEEPMSLEIERVGGPPNSLFAQIGGFAFLGPQVAGNPLLTTLVSLVPPLPFMPPTLRGAFTALILVVRGGSEQSKYMALASSGDPNVVSQPSSNAEFLANQLQSNGHYQLADGEALVLTIDPGRANYFVVPTYDIWTITDDYWNEQTSLNNEQAEANDDGTYTIVISKTDPGGVKNWVSTGGLNQGTISIRFQDLQPDPGNVNAPKILSQEVISVDDADELFPDEPRFFVDRAVQLAERKDGFNKRWAPFPQP